MTNLFIELYLDEDVSVLIADLVWARGFNALTTREAGQLHANDDNQLAYAVRHHKTVLTHNRADFEALAHTYFVAGQMQLRHHYRGAASALRNSAAVVAYPQSDHRRRNTESVALYLTGIQAFNPRSR